MMSNLNMFCQTVSDLFQDLLFELNLGNKLKNTNFKLYRNTYTFSSKESVVRLKYVPVFLSYFYFLVLM